MKLICSTRNNKGKKYLLASTGMAIVASTLIAGAPAQAQVEGSLLAINTNAANATSNTTAASVIANAQFISYKNEFVFYSKNIKNGKAGSSIIIKDKNGKQIGTGKLNENGTVGITIKEKVPIYSKLTLTVTNLDGKTEQANMTITYFVLGTPELMEKVNSDIKSSNDSSNDSNNDSNESTEDSDKQQMLIAKNGKSYALANLKVNIVEQVNYNKSKLKIELIDTEQNVKLPALKDRITIKYNETNGKFYIGNTEIKGNVPKGFVIKNKRIVRALDGSGYVTVPHEVVNDTFTFTTYEFSNLIFTNSYNAEFEDISTSYSKKEIEMLNIYLVSQGTTSKQYSPSKEITRAEFAVMVARALELKPKVFTVDFKDIEGKWYAKEVQAMFEAGLIKGFENGSFSGNSPLIREQAAVILTRMLDYMGTDTKNKSAVTLEDASLISSYAKNGVYYLAEHEVISSGEGISFNPKMNLNREQMAKMLLRSLQISDWY